METRSIEETSMIDVKIHKESLEKDERRYAYEKAIEAYWKHVDRYHTWMNYYAIFNGALFVGFCTLLTATTEIEKQCNGSSFILSNEYGLLLLLICSIGMISSLCWMSSLNGHTIWMKNWMRIIETYEDMLVYKLIITNNKEFKLEDYSVENFPRELKDGEYYKASSTSKITFLFILSVFIGWMVALFYAIYTIYKNQDFCSFIEALLIHAVMFIIIILIVLLFIYLLILMNINGYFDKFEKLFSSDVNKKIIIIKQ